MFIPNLLALIGISTQKQKSLDFKSNFLKETVLPKTKVYKISDNFNEKKNVS